MKKIVILFTMFYIFLSVTNVKAADCSYNELKELKQLAQKVEIGYSPSISEDGDKAIFTLTAFNMDPKFYLKINGVSIVSYVNKSTEVGTFSSGNKIKVVVFSSNKTNCVDERLYSFDIELPVYNKFYNTEECIKNRKKDICKKWYDSSNISEEKFKELLKEKEEKKESMFTKIIQIIGDSPIALAAIALYVLLIIVIVIIFRKRKVKLDI